MFDTVHLVVFELGEACRVGDQKPVVFVSSPAHNNQDAKGNTEDSEENCQRKIDNNIHQKWKSDRH
jgi:hypothetical protein